MKRPKYIIVAGVNGAGKSTLYKMDRPLFEDTKRLNADEILRANGGDWHSKADSIKAMREEVKQIHEALKNRESIHVETTLAGNGSAQRKLIDIAHQANYEVSLVYVALDSPKTAVRRVKERVKKGGHGISDELVIKRYSQSLDNLAIIASLSDNVTVYDNTDKLNLIFQRIDNKETVNELNSYPNISVVPTVDQLLEKHIIGPENDMGQEYKL